ncbi:hypothetical protein [Pseudomonas sp. 22 E 5]|uniref:hypothetical protein n=1 Tax=Pseudomonas lurida TaxID=244566 RepID=UPI000811E8ED|nr:hypothetical protein [Pseudomonas lurida]MBD8669798.1 hypothetical protein [Pseudomonas lurida]UZQ74153.1 hypothetical protein OQ519_25105 [Pseudomonas lurida]CRM94471.1 hypothetical protein [Pseudomonas sp. 22 E 5]
MNEAQIEQMQEIVQEIATDEGISFDEAFAIAMGNLKQWVDRMPKGRSAAGCSGGSKR